MLHIQNVNRKWVVFLYLTFVEPHSCVFTMLHCKPIWIWLLYTAI